MTNLTTSQSGARSPAAAAAPSPPDPSPSFRSIDPAIPSRREATAPSPASNAFVDALDPVKKPLFGARDIPPATEDLLPKPSNVQQQAPSRKRKASPILPPISLATTFHSSDDKSTTIKTLPPPALPATASTTKSAASSLPFPPSSAISPQTESPHRHAQRPRLSLSSNDAKHNDDPSAAGAARASTVATDIESPASANRLGRRVQGGGSGRGVASLTPEQLAKKRANDREAQRAIRTRTRAQIESLERQVRELSTQQPLHAELVAMQTRAECAEAETREIKATLAQIMALIGPLVDTNALSRHLTTHEDNTPIATSEAPTEPSRSTTAVAAAAAAGPGNVMSAPNSTPAPGRMHSMSTEHRTHYHAPSSTYAGSSPAVSNTSVSESWSAPKDQATTARIASPPLSKSALTPSYGSSFAGSISRGTLSVNFDRMSVGVMSQHSISQANPARILHSPALPSDSHIILSAIHSPTSAADRYIDLVTTPTATTHLTTSVTTTVQGPTAAAAPPPPPTLRTPLLPLPPHSAASCPLDQLLLDFLADRRRLAASGLSRQELLGPAYPSFDGLLSSPRNPIALQSSSSSSSVASPRRTSIENPNTPGPSAADHTAATLHLAQRSTGRQRPQHAISRLFADVIPAFPDISAPPEQIAVMYVMFLVMRWQCAAVCYPHLASARNEVRCIPPTGTTANATAPAAASIAASSPSPLTPNFPPGAGLGTPRPTSIGSATGAPSASALGPSHSSVPRNSLGFATGFAPTPSTANVDEFDAEGYLLQLLPWMKPTPLQLRVPHPIWIDHLPWPHMRDKVILHPERYPLESFFIPYTTTLRVNWTRGNHCIFKTSQDKSSAKTSTADTPSNEYLGGRDSSMPDHAMRDYGMREPVPTREPLGRSISGGSSTSMSASSAGAHGLSRTSTSSSSSVYNSPLPSLHGSYFSPAAPNSIHNPPAGSYPVHNSPAGPHAVHPLPAGPHAMASPVGSGPAASKKAMSGQGNLASFGSAHRSPSLPANPHGASSHSTSMAASPPSQMSPTFPGSSSSPARHALLHRSSSTGSTGSRPGAHDMSSSNRAGAGAGEMPMGSGVPIKRETSMSRDAFHRSHSGHGSSVGMHERGSSADRPNSSTGLHQNTRDGSNFSTGSVRGQADVHGTHANGHANPVAHAGGDAIEDGEPSLDMAFEDHIRSLVNWSLGPAFATAFPDLVDGVTIRDPAEIDA